MSGLSHTPEDREVVAAQLGRAPRGSWRVALRCHLGVPMVIENHPRLDDGTPFPTLYWLTCPILVKRVGGLESKGWMGHVNERLARDGALRERLSSAIADLEARRDALEPIPAAAPPGGGPDRVKCLHAHTAHALAARAAGTPDPVGALTLAETGWPDCIAPCVPGAAR